jgi:formiminoglutamase
MPDPRLADLLGRDAGPARAVVIGFPSDEGVRRNGGRPGAARGPQAIREALARLTPDAEASDRFRALIERTHDLGDITVTGDVERDQATLGSEVRAHLNDGRFVLVLGGGHETAFGHFLGYTRPVDLLNWDAHADVREAKAGRAHSGSPFRQALEHPSGLCRSYHVAGLQPQSVAADHVAFVRAHGSATFRNRLTTAAAVDSVFDRLGDAALVSFDLDAVDHSQAPGVSAPATDGLPVELWLRAAFMAGSDPRVRSADIVELSPPHDRDGQTARLAALTAWHLLRGLAARPA